MRYVKVFTMGFFMVFPNCPGSFLNNNAWMLVHDWPLYKHVNMSEVKTCLLTSILKKTELEKIPNVQPHYFTREMHW